MTLIEGLCVSLVMVLCGAFTLWIWPTGLPSAKGGVRGIRRAVAVRSSPLARMCLPIIEAVSMKLAPLHRLRSLRRRCEETMQLSGNPWGMGGDEFIAALSIGTLAGAVSGALITRVLTDATVPGVLIGTCFGTAFVWFRVADIRHQRLAAINRDLPGAIDMISLSMHAGLDFSRALRLLTLEMDPQHPLRFELALVLDRLSLGASRRVSMRELVHRIPLQVVRDFSGSVIQSEIQGTPLGEVLAIQARTMRLVRSQNAEQAASRAAILLLGPLMLIFLSVFLLLLGPFAIKAARGELF